MGNNKMALNRGAKVLLALVIIFLGAFLYNNYLKAQILTRSQFAQCLVYKVEPYKKPTPPMINCLYHVNGQVYSAGYAVENIIAFSQLKMLEDKRVLVMYDSSKPERNRMLLTKEDYLEFKLPYPDSLSWIEALLNE